MFFTKITFPILLVILDYLKKVHQKNILKYVLATAYGFCQK